MVWHIFRKDWKLLWQFALAVAVLEAGTVVISFERGHFTDNRVFSSLLVLLELCVYVGAGCLITAVAHQDAIPGVRQDWLVRPIRRRDLLMAKLLFVLIAIQMPLLIASVAEGLVDGFSFTASSAAAVSQNLHLLVAFSIPILAFVSLTKNLTESIASGLTVFAAIIAFGIVLAGVQGGNPLGATNNSAIQWIPEAIRYAVYLLGAACILGIQYFRRKTSISRYAFAGTVLLCIGTALVPWKSAFALQERLSAHPKLGDEIRIGFQPGLGRFQPPSRVDLQANRNRMIRQARLGDASLYIPVRITGMPDNSILKVDRSVARIVRANGKASTLSIPNDLGDDLEVDNDGARKAETLTHQPVRIIESVYEQVKNESVRLEIDESFTLMRLSAAHAIPALDGNQRTPDAGWCKTRLNESATAVQVSCLQVGMLPFDCVTAFLEKSNSGARNPARSGCGPDYQPYFGQYEPIDIVSRFGVGLAFYDPAGVAKYPVDGSQIPQARVVISMYKAQDHFTRQVLIPAIRLSDWTPR
jgi:hypothetical protein